MHNKKIWIFHAEARVIGWQKSKIEKANIRISFLKFTLFFKYIFFNSNIEINQGKGRISHLENILYFLKKKRNKEF